MDHQNGLIPILMLAIDRARDCDVRDTDAETLHFWRELIVEAQEATVRCSRFEADDKRALHRLIDTLDAELDRRPPAAMPAGCLRISRA